MKVLHMTLKKKWFDLIISGIKTEEYREIKPYWDTRLSEEYDIIRFKNGYNKNSPTFDIELKGIKKESENKSVVVAPILFIYYSSERSSHHLNKTYKALKRRKSWLVYF